MAKQHTAMLGIERFKDLYDNLNRDSLTHERLASVYSDNVVFADSLHRIEGLDAMYQYFENMYENVERIHFDWQELAANDSDGFIRWTMTFSHPRLNSGKEIAVHGSSHLRIEDGKVTEHRDFFDAGEMLYEHIPALGLIIRKLKKRLA